MSGVCVNIRGGSVSKRDGLTLYKQVNVAARIEGASPHRLIQMLLEGGLGALAEAKGAMARGEIEQKGRKITKAINIISGLRDALNPEVDSQLPYNLERLYDYMQRTLLEAHSRNNEQQLDEVVEMLTVIKSGWDKIGP